MGTSAEAHCQSCGYEASFLLGGGRANHQTFAAWPVHCEDCSAITTANFKSNPLTCKQCGGCNVVPVMDRREWQGDGKSTINWANLSLTDGHYRCPKCRTFKLKFRPGMMMWD